MLELHFIILKVHFFNAITLYLRGKNKLVNKCTMQLANGGRGIQTPATSAASERFISSTTAYQDFKSASLKFSDSRGNKLKD